MKSRILLRTQVARVGACLALLNFAVPGGALVSFGVPAKEAVGRALAARRAAQKDLEARQRKSASRLLSKDEQDKLQGRSGENPYLAGGAKWDPVYKGIDLLTGNYATSATDMSFDGGYGIPVNVTRSYSANQIDEGPFGKGWTLSADVRSTAGGLLKSGGAPVRSIPLNLKERSDAETDPNVTVQPAQAVTATDAGGTEETVQKDVDGILTTPAWDKNVYDSLYEWVTLNGATYQVLVSNTVKTPEGTVYTYAKEGTYPYGTVPWNNPGATPQAANVLKVTTATDRQGNVTTYSYGGSTVTFSHSTGTTVEHPLVGVSMPGGHNITLTWGSNPNAASSMRLTSVSDGTGGRTVSYGYTGQAGHGLLASVTTPGGKTTQYGYGSPWVKSDWAGDVASNLLTTITDPRGLTMTIEYAMAKVDTGFAYVPGAAAYRILMPNGTSAFANYGYFISNDTSVGQTQGNAPPDCLWPLIGAGSRFASTRVGDKTGARLEDFEVVTTAYGNGDFLVRTQDFGNPGFSVNSTFATQDFDRASQNLLEDKVDDNAGNSRGLASARAMALGYAGDRGTVTTKTYNFMGQPLSATVVEQTSSGGSQPTTTRTAHVDYAYWGADKYYQQKATRDPAGRIAVTDYYPSTAPAGKRGQTYRVYDPKYGGTGTNTNIQPPSYALPGTEWRYQVVFAANQYTAQFDYDTQGRPIDVWKLQSATSNPYAYVRTHTSHGGDGSPSWGQASQVVEDYGGIGRTTRIQACTAWGKASDVIDAAGHEFVTNYDLDGQVNSVTRTDGGLNQTVVSYAYGTSGLSTGQPTQVTDGLSGVVQTITYTPSGGGIGAPASVTETNGSDSYSTSYAYLASGDRSTATYATPSGTRTWQYADYLPVGKPGGGGRAFQTLARLDASGNRTAEEFHYVYDSAGRLAASAFAQSPYVDGSHLGYVPTTAGAPYYDASHLASRRALATYAYDAGGRLTDVATNWQAAPDGGGSYVTTGIAENACAYELSGLNRGLKTSSAFTMANAAMSGYDTRTETYGYDAAQDQLTSASYGDSNPNATPSWAYDAAGNRNDSVTDSLNRATSLGGASVTNDVLGNRLTKGGATYGWDVLNRMTSLSGAVTASYAYRADGMRVSKQSGGVTTLYRHDGQMGVEDVETPASGSTTVTRYGLGARGVDMIERTNSSGTVTAFPIYDAHGNNVASLTRSGLSFQIGDRRTYDAWGVVRSQQSGGDPKLRYCASLGHKQDDESGLVYMRARYYEPNSGRFVSEDPAEKAGNWFVYCGNNPITYSDFSGKDFYHDLDKWLENGVPRGYLTIFSCMCGAAGMLMAIASVGSLVAAKTVGQLAAAVTLAENAIFMMAVAFSANAYSRASGLADAGVCAAAECALESLKPDLDLIAADTAVGSKGLAGTAVCAAFTYDLFIMGALVSNAIDDWNN